MRRAKRTANEEEQSRRGARARDAGTAFKARIDRALDVTPSVVVAQGRTSRRHPPGFAYVIVERGQELERAIRLLRSDR